MSEYVFFKDRIVPAGDAAIGAVSAAAMFGRSIFSTAAIRHGVPVLWEKHWRRLTASAAKLNIDISRFSREGVRRFLLEILERNVVADGRARITFFDESSTDIWPFDTDRKTNLLIMATAAAGRAENFRLTLSPYSINSASPLAGIKYGGYLEKSLALDEAKRRGFDEAVQFNERGIIVSACMANIFWVDGGKLLTPALQTACLAGTTRDFIMENLECSEVEAGIEALQSADQIFLTSAGIGIGRVTDFGGRPLSSNAHPILELWNHLS